MHPPASLRAALDHVGGPLLKLKPTLIRPEHTRRPVRLPWSHPDIAPELRVPASGHVTTLRAPAALSTAALGFWAHKTKGRWAEGAELLCTSISELRLFQDPSQLKPRSPIELILPERPEGFFRGGIY